ncbi:MAG: calcineurin-like phosphoesterase family protein [Hyphomicrobiaceae bacterium]|nr:calcineurin-like phosphoesterase family protein [Hyphomicrobiaceae bacterium]
MAYHPSRRQLLAGAGASALAASASALPRDAVVARGVVYEDKRGAGPRRPGDRGIAGVMVSNGRDVALTGPDGAFALAVEPGDSVFVIKPAHWMTRTTAAGLPQFSYLYQPEGSPPQPGLRFPVVEPTGALPHSIDFALMRHEEAPEFEALLVSDTQPDSLAELSYVRDDIVAGLLGVGGAAFGINHGDVVADDLSLYPRYLSLLGSTGFTWHHCPGNHDINYAAPDDRHSRETWKHTFGPRSYAFQHGQATFFILDNVEYLGRGRYRGALGVRQLQFIRNVLTRVPREHLVVLSMHIPLVCYLEPDNPADTTADWRALLKTLAGYGHTVSFAGHLHTTEHHYLDGEDASVGAAPHHHHVLTAACGSWWSGPSDSRGIPCAESSDGTPNGFHVLSVAGNRYTTRFVPAAGKAPAQLRLLIDGPHRRARDPGACDRLGLTVPHEALVGCRVLANVFDGGPRTRVTLEVAGRPERVAMAPATAPDPLVSELFAGDSPRKSWVAATPCAHLWQAALPAGLVPGAHVLLVRARDEYGREHTARAVLELTGPGA